MYRRIKKALRVRLKNLADQLSPIKYNDYTKFIILCHPRTGSTLLHTYLDDHLQIRSYGELLGLNLPEKISQKNITAVDYVRASAFCSHSRAIRAVGFKYFYQYAESVEGREVLDYLRENQTIKIIHLIRKNPLRTLISYKLARSDGAWTFNSNMHDKIKIDPAAVVRELAGIEQKMNFFTDMFTNHPCLTVSYEQLVDDPLESLDSIQRFLGLPSKKLNSVLKIQHPSPILSYVENAEKLKQRLRRTEFEKYLDT